MRCDFCLSKDPKYFKDGVCRRCLHLRHGLYKPVFYDVQGVSGEYTLNFDLTPFQKDISSQIVKHMETSDVFLEAVCGAGKTEMCYELIKVSLQKGLKVGWAIPRRQVVLELTQRLQDNFKAMKVIPVCEGFTSDLIGDLIVCTTHQLFRYHQVFDVLILDEPDAFPFANDDLLYGVMKQSVKGHVLYMSATQDDVLMAKLDQCIHLKMPLRPNLKPLPVPQVRNSYLHLIKDLKGLKGKRILIFVPTIKIAHRLSQFLKVPCITSKTEDKEQVLESYLNHEFDILITTTILERGVTFLNCYVFVFEAHHNVFDASSLVQIAGRVLRGSSYEGACYFYGRYKSEGIDKCLNYLEVMNQLAYRALNP